MTLVSTVSTVSRVCRESVEGVEPGLNMGDERGIRLDPENPESDDDSDGAPELVDNSD